MNGVSIFAMKQFGFGLSDLGQSWREKSVRTGQGATQIGTTQIGSGTWMKFCQNQRRERAMQRFKSSATLQKFTSYHAQLYAQIYNHFNHERHLESRQSFKQKRATALAEWFNFCAA